MQLPYLGRAEHRQSAYITPNQSVQVPPDTLKQTNASAHDCDDAMSSKAQASASQHSQHSATAQQSAVAEQDDGNAVVTVTATFQNLERMFSAGKPLLGFAVDDSWSRIKLQQLSSAPHLLIVDDFFDANTCRQLMQLAEPHLIRSRVASGKGVSVYRASRGCGSV